MSTKTPKKISVLKKDVTRKGNFFELRVQLEEGFPRGTTKKDERETSIELTKLYEDSLLQAVFPHITLQVCRFYGLNDEIEPEVEMVKDGVLKEVWSNWSVGSLAHGDCLVQFVVAVS